jgi:hypothetical protein
MRDVSRSKKVVEKLVFIMTLRFIAAHVRWKTDTLYWVPCDNQVAST